MKNNNAFNRRTSQNLDRGIRRIVAATVVILALVSAAISFNHLYRLAQEHHQTGLWAIAFPICVDGLELVASLVLLAKHREPRDHAARRPWREVALPWTALAVGTLASLGANIAVGPTDLLGRAISGWPAVALLVTLKLAAGQLAGPERSGGPVRTARPVIVLDGSTSGLVWSVEGPTRSSDGPGWSADSGQRPDNGSGPVRSAWPDRT